MLKIISALVATATLLTAAPSFADGYRRAEVGARIVHQERRIGAGVRAGELTRGQAWRLRRADVRIARQERRDVWRNGGYLARGQAWRLDREENRVSRRIYVDRRY
ncbi:MAG TPA: hypothetical protein VLX92_22230 [Kofleriaceae bacterium]|nr:hypothetical protein [Kofleriaceae bacterium]